MSAIKQTKRRQGDVQTASSLPASKRFKASTDSSPRPVKKSSSLDFLVDEDARSGRLLEAKLTNGVPSKKALRVDESHAVVASDTSKARDRTAVKSTPVVELVSSDEDGENDDDSSDMDPEEAAAILAEEEAKAKRNAVPQLEKLGQTGTNTEEPTRNGVSDVDEDNEPTFGDLLQARHPEPVDVLATYDNAGELGTTNNTGYQAAPSSGSLGTVLTQALKTNDAELLQSCFRVTNVESIHSTIQRLPSQLVGTLLQRIAERIHSRPGRAGTLVIWIQWSLVAHGGYLAGQPDVMKKLKALSGVLKERASGLQPLLHLKGKLDMLSAQLELRRKLQATSRAANADAADDEEGVLYVEGQASDWSDDDEVDVPGKALVNGDVKKGKAVIKHVKSKRITSKAQDLSDEELEDDDDDVDMAGMTNGVSDEDEDEEEEDEDEEGLLDVEAEETSDDDGDDIEGEDDEDDSEGSEIGEEEEEEDEEEADSEAEAAPPARHRLLNRKR